MTSERSIFVTGAEGFIGSHLVEALVESGSKVKALCQYNSFGSSGWLSHLSTDISSRIEIVFGDIRDIEQMRQYVQGCEIIVNLAALIAIPYSYIAPRSYVEVNTLGTINLLEAARLYKAKLIHISTSEVYGTPLVTPITEGHAINPQSPYAASKSAADHFVMSYYDSYSMNSLIVRPFNTYGPRQSPRAVIPTILSQIIFGAEKLKVGSTSPLRDFTFVTDTTRAIVEAVHSNISGEVIHLGTGKAISVGELIETCQDICGTSIEIEEEQSRVRPINSEVQILLSDPKKAKELLGWEAKVDLRSGLEQTKKWIEANPESFQGSQKYRL